MRICCTPRRRTWRIRNAANMNWPVCLVFDLFSCFIFFSFLLLISALQMLVLVCILSARFNCTNTYIFICSNLRGTRKFFGFIIFYVLFLVLNFCAHCNSNLILIASCLLLLFVCRFYFFIVIFVCTGLCAVPVIWFLYFSFDFVFFFV